MHCQKLVLHFCYEPPMNWCFTVLVFNQAALNIRFFTKPQ